MSNPALLAAAAVAVTLALISPSVATRANFDPNEFCRGINAGIFPHPDGSLCFQYVSCLFGEGFVYECNEGFVFDADKFVCVPGDWAECEEGGTVDPDLERICADVSLGVFEYERDCGKFLFCNRGEAQVMECDANEIWVQERGVCAVGSRDTCEEGDLFCMGRPDGAIEHPDGCHLFIECRNQIHTVVTCSRGYVFDGRGGCVVGHSETCETSEDLCDGDQGVMHPHPEFCDLFVECDGSYMRAGSCGINEIFRYDIQFCVPGNPDTCIPSRPEVACEGRPDGIIPHPDECNMFIVCTNGVSSSHNCPHGEILRPELPFCVAGDSETCEFLDGVCVGRPDGFVIEHPNYCGSFIWCQGGQVQIHPCPAGEILREDMQFCVPGDLNTCEFSPVENMCDGRMEDLRFPHPDRCDQVVICSGGSHSVQSCPPYTIVQPGSIQCVPGNPESCDLYTDMCVGRPDGVIPHPSRCHLFINCQSGQVQMQSCPDGHIFDSSDSQCVPGNVETCDHLDEYCVGKEDGVISHPNRCDLFMICAGGVTTVHPCPTGEILRPDMQFCVPGNSATCQFDPVEQMCNGREGPLVFPHPYDCSLLVRCQGGQYTIESCQDGAVVQPGRITCVAGNRDTCELYNDRCVGIPDDRIPHPSECHVFLQCNGGATNVQSCPRGTIFQGPSCVVGDRESCELLDQTCEPIRDPTILEHPNFCDLFIECRDGTTTLRTCSPGLILHPNMQVCSPGDSHSCNFREIEDMCVGQPLIRFPPPSQTQCAEYVTCSGGTPTVNSCRDGTVLRPRFLDCVAGNEQTCANFAHICLFRPNEYIAHPARCDMFISCVSEIPNVVDCPAGHIFNSFTRTCVPGDAQTCETFDNLCRGSPNGVLPHPGSCNMFIRCIESNAMVDSCPVGNIFHQASGDCVPGNAQTCNLYNDRCSNQPNGVIEFPGRCDLFIACHEGTSTAHQCPSGEILNVDIQFCMPGNPQTCEFDQDPEDPVLSICQGREDGQFVHPFFCYQFIQCLGGQTIIGTCPAGQIFVPSLGRCAAGDASTCEAEDSGPPGGEVTDDLCTRTGIYNVAHPNLDLCWMYVRCVFRVAFEMECPIFHVFSPVFAICVPGDRNNC